MIAFLLLEYHITMYDSKTRTKTWNVTFYDYSSHRNHEASQDYGINVE